MISRTLLDVVPIGPDDFLADADNGTMWWLYVLIALVVIAAIVATILIARRNRRNKR